MLEIKCNSLKEYLDTLLQKADELSRDSDVLAVPADDPKRLIVGTMLSADSTAYHVIVPIRAARITDGLTTEQIDIFKDSMRSQIGKEVFCKALCKTKEPV